MASTHSPSSLPRVTAILVVTNGEEWLPHVLATIAAQRYSGLDLVVVDNGSSDGSPALLRRRIRSDRLLTLPSTVGFGRAVAAAFGHDAVREAEMLLLLHDDLVLAPDALPRLVAALRADPSLSIVGPKLREWGEQPVLQEVGMTVDRFGRAEPQLEPGELDQGQHDTQRAVLYVSTAGMLLRSEVLRDVGRFDPRYHLLRDDFDLCWRAWLAGLRVEVVPSAVGYHVAAASRSLRPEVGARPWTARELAERHTLATLLKCYGAARLAWVLPVVMLLAVAKIVGFTATRRFGDAAAVARAWTWNLAQLPRTLRRRRAVQRRRQVSDGELAGLFAPGLPRLRAYGEAMGDWLAGGETEALLEEEPAQPAPETGNRLVRMFRRYPALTVGLLLLVAYLAGLLPVLGGGQLVAGEVKPWPGTAGAFLRAYVSPLSGEPLASGAAPSPVQALLGLASLAAAGSAWLAQRLLVFGLLPLAWLLALRAGRLLTAAAVPRVLGATLYALSPVLVGALAQGRWSVALSGALLPGLVLLAAQATRPGVKQASGWRAAALLSLGLAAVAGAAPALWLLPVAVLFGALLLAARADRAALLRVGVVVAGTLGLLAPWLYGLVRAGTAPPGVHEAAPLPLWRALTGVPALLPGLNGAGGFVAASMAVAVVVAALLLGVRLRPAAVVGLVAALVGAGLLAWASGRLRVGPWSPGLLLPGALALAGLGVVAARSLAASLRGYAFGVRQLTVVAASLALAVGLLAAVAGLAGGPWDAYVRRGELVPAFVTADVERVGPYRVLLLSGDGAGVRWDVVAGDGPSMTTYGTVRSRSLQRFVAEAVGDIAGFADARAGTRLGLVNVRYVVLAADSPAELRAALDRQPHLEPVPSGGGRVYRVASWLPRAAVLPADRGAALLATGNPGRTAGMQAARLEQVRAGVYAGSAEPAGGLLVIAEERSPRWVAAAGGQRLERAEAGADAPLPLNAFAVPASPAQAPVRVTARAGGGLARQVVVALQALLALGIVSLALRPPGFTARRGNGHGRRLPRELSVAPLDSDAPPQAGVAP